MISRVVLDTNLLVSALIFGGTASRLRQLWQSNSFTPLASKATITELIRVLAYPKLQLNQLEQEELLADYLPFCETIRIPRSPPTIPLCRDPFDTPFLVLASVGQADYLVSGDQDLLVLAGQFICPIITMENFFRLSMNKSS